MAPPVASSAWTAHPAAWSAGAVAVAARSWRTAGAATATATVRSPAAVCAARSRATIRRPYQNPGCPSGASSSPGAGAPGVAEPAGGGWDS